MIDLHAHFAAGATASAARATAPAARTTTATTGTARTTAPATTATLTCVVERKPVAGPTLPGALRVVVDHDGALACV